VRVTTIKQQVAEDRIRVVVHLDRQVRFVAGTATDPYRIFFDLEGARPADTLAAKTFVGDIFLRRIRVAQYQPGITRVVLDMGQAAPYSVRFLDDPPRLEIEIWRAGGSHLVAAPAPDAVARTPTAAAPPARGLSGTFASSESKLASRFAAAGDPGALLEAARRGSSSAQFEMGNLYMTGHGVGRDPVAAASWYRAAAQQAHAAAASNLGVLYANGWGVPLSDAEAVNWFRKAADAGDPGGENNLGSMYIAGRGVPQSDALGAKYILSAAEHGAPEAQYALGTLYANGRGVPADDEQAVKWLKASATQGYAPAQVVLGKLYAAGAGVPRDYPEAYCWFAMAAASGDKEAAAEVNSIAPRLTAEQLAQAQQRALTSAQPRR